MLETTCDDMLFGRLKLLQPLNGQRVSMDTILLSAWVKVRSGTRKVLEAGCATGAVSLLLAMKHRNIRVTGVDIQPELIELANLNASNNDLSDRVTFIAGDIRDKNLLPLVQDAKAQILPGQPQGLKSHAPPMMLRNLLKES